MVITGAGIMLYGIIKFYNLLVRFKAQINARKLFSSFIYMACFVMMLFFLIGYVIIAVSFTLNTELGSHDLLIAVIFFLGAVFVTAMVTMLRRMFESVTDKAELKKQLQQQELMSAISQSFTTVEEYSKLIYEALKMSGEFMGVNHSFLAQYSKESNLQKLCVSTDGCRKRAKRKFRLIGSMPLMPCALLLSKKKLIIVY